MDWAGNAHRSNNLLAHADCGRNSGNSRLSFFDRSSPALLLGLVQGRENVGFVVITRGPPISVRPRPLATARARASSRSSVASHAFPFAVV